MLRITPLTPVAGMAALKVEGWIAGEEVAVLEQSGEAVLAQGHGLLLELGGVRSIDEAGLALLERWSERGLVLRRPSSFVRQLLARHGLRWVEEGEPG